MREKRSSDPIFKFKAYLRNRIWRAFNSKNWKSNSNSVQLIGCSHEEAFKHIESQFKKGMSWDNYGEWHVDHKICLCEAETKLEMEKLCHYTNLQPLWAIDNFKKDKCK